MGRTNPTFRDLLRATESRWQAYRRVLRRRDRERFDRLFVDAADHADAAGHLNHEEPLFPVLFSVCLAQERRIDELSGRVAELEAAVEREGTAPPSRATDPPSEPADSPTEAADGPPEGR